MSDPLATYLNDHRAGAAGAIELLEAVAERQRGRKLGWFAAELLIDVREDRDVLERLAKPFGTPSVLKEAAGWLAGKLSRLKMPGDDEDDLRTFEALEAVVVGIGGKKALWDALAIIAPSDARLQGFDFMQLARRAQGQMDRVNGRRLELAPRALTAAAEPAAR
jgi:hypothetical protein